MSPATEENTSRVARALVDLIYLLDYWRPSWKPSLGLLLCPAHKLERCDPDFPRDIISWVKEYDGDQYFRYEGLKSAKIVSIKESHLFSKYYNKKYGKERDYDLDLKKMAQRTIEYATEYFKKNGIDPKEYPIKLAFNDYEGLTYERKGKRYLAFITVD
ncbi:MAG: hypothetical protein HY555_04275 [Euryarchaeota archaeon]|nr:hypothetical protein [Euryarchaeota archaeon]